MLDGWTNCVCLLLVLVFVLKYAVTISVLFRDIVPVENWFVSLFGLGEGWHNYHHTFPWDYKAAELGQYYNLTTTLLDQMEKWGWVYDLRSASAAMVQHRISQRGDGTHPLSATPTTELEDKETSTPQLHSRVQHRRPGL